MICSTLRINFSGNVDRKSCENKQKVLVLLHKNRPTKPVLKHWVEDPSVQTEIGQKPQRKRRKLGHDAKEVVALHLQRIIPVPCKFTTVVEKYNNSEMEEQ
jgi:hypothetical protein